MAYEYEVTKKSEINNINQVHYLLTNDYLVHPEF